MTRSRAAAVASYLNGELRKDQLSFKEEDYLDQMLNVYRLMTEGHPKTFIRRYLSEEYALGYAAQYQLERDTELVFGNMNKINRAIELHIAVEMAKTAYSMALEKGQVTNMIKAQQALVKAIGDDPGDTPDFEKLQPSLIVAALPEGMEQQMELLFAQGHINLNKAPKVIDIPHEDVSE